MKYNERGKSRIEVSDILNYFKDIDSYYNDCTRYDTLKRMLEDIVAETKEDAERKTGRWTHAWGTDDAIWKCSECGFEIDAHGCVDPVEYLETYKFCPNCGSDNREGGDRT